MESANIIFVLIALAALASLILIACLNEGKENQEFQNKSIKLQNECSSIEFKHLKILEAIPQEIISSIGGTTDGKTISINLSYDDNDKQSIKEFIATARQIKREISLLKSTINHHISQAKLDFSAILLPLPRLGTGKYGVRAERARIQELNNIAKSLKSNILQRYEEKIIILQRLTTQLDTHIQRAISIRPSPPAGL